MTSRMLPRIEPTSDALTTSWSHSLSAKNAMISSGALPNVTFKKPPMPEPDRAASSSVARPFSAAVGITPAADVTKIAVALACTSSSAIATGMNGTSRYGQPEPLNKEPAQVEPGPLSRPGGHERSRISSTRLSTRRAAGEAKNAMNASAVGRAGPTVDLTTNHCR